MDNIAVEVNNVTKSFTVSKAKGISGLISSKLSSKIKSFKALDGISFNINKGEVLGIIGTNGSGKSTLLRLIAGIYKPDKGYVKLNGRLSPLMQIGAGFQAEFGARENIIINGMLLGLKKKDVENQVQNIIKYAELENFSNLKLKQYSTGMRARLAFATAMQINPDILLIDEILAVGDKNFKKKSYETFLDFKKKNKTILLVTHSTSQLSEICDNVLLLNKGKQIILDKPDVVIKKYNEIIS